MGRRKTRKVQVGNLFIGGDAPISVQSMAKTDTRDIEATVKQIHRLEVAGCELVRVAVPDMEAAEKLGEIKRKISIPLVADIHFDYRLALEALKQGVDKLRLNPGNIRDKEKVRLIAQSAKVKGVPIRIGVNAGSLAKDILKKCGQVTSAALVESALEEVNFLESLGLFDLVISLKAFDVPMTIQAYRLISEKVDYPLHIGITESGLPLQGSIRSAVALGVLLSEGIGDTIRVSLTGPPTEEVEVGFEILKSLNLRQKRPVIVSCPTCGRCEIDLVKITKQVSKLVERNKTLKDKPIKIAVMGCLVNGPGEAKEADLGIAGGKGVGLLFKKGEVVRKVKESELIEALIEEIRGTGV